MSIDVMTEYTITKIRQLLESDARTRKLYTRWLATQDSLLLNRLLIAMTRKITRDVATLNRRVLKAINRGVGEFPWKIQFSHTFPGPEPYVFSHTKFNKQTTPTDDRTVPISDQGAFTMRLFQFPNDDKTYDWSYGYNSSAMDVRNNDTISRAVNITGDLLEAAGYTMDEDS